ncbi:MAG: PspA/IM30 family protein, partial [bacterium]|nr:PspA/IM30 family protein [bacterium]
HEREIAMVKTADKVDQASKSISQYIDGGKSNMMSATESLERIKLRLQDESDRMAAAEALRAELSGQSLEAKLKAAGIGAEANRKKQVLVRLKGTSKN